MTPQNLHRIRVHPQPSHPHAFLQGRLSSVRAGIELDHDAMRLVAHHEFFLPGHRGVTVTTATSKILNGDYILVLLRSIEEAETNGKKLE